MVSNNAEEHPAPRLKPVRDITSQDRPRGGPRQEKAPRPMRRSSRIPKPSQRRLDFDELHLSLEEACNIIEERMVPEHADSMNVCNGYVDARLVQMDDEASALGVEPLNLQEVEQSEDRIKWK